MMGHTETIEFGYYARETNRAVDFALASHGRGHDLDGDRVSLSQPGSPASSR